MYQSSYNPFKTNTRALRSKKNLDKLTKMRYKCIEIFVTPYINMAKLNPKVIGLATLATLASCDKDKDLPTPEPVVKATTDTRTQVEQQTLVINNTNNGNSTTIRVTDKAGNVELDTTFTAQQFMHRLNDLPADEYTTKTVTKKDKTANATDTDIDTIEQPEPTVTASAELIIHEQNIKEDMPVGTEVIDLNATFTVDGQTKTVAELQALGYEVIFTTNNNEQLTIDQLKGLLAQKLNVDGENNTNPADKANLVANFTLTVKKNGVVKATQALNLNQKIIDTQNWKPTISGKHLNKQDGTPLIAEHENGTTYKQWTDVKNIYNPNNQEAISNTSVQQFIDAGNGRFEVENLSGRLYPKVKTGPYVGMYIDTERAIETMRRAMSDGASEYIQNSNVGASYERANKALGNLVSQLLDDPNAFTIYTSSGGWKFITPKDAVKIAANAVVEVMQQQGQTLDPAQ